RLLGWSRAEALGRTAAELIVPPQERSRYERALARWSQAGEATLGDHAIEAEALTRDGRTIPIELTVAAVGSGRSTTLHACLHDVRRRRVPDRARLEAEAITARLASERALRDAEERFRRSFDEAPIGMALISLEGRWSKVNDAMCEIVGYSQAQLMELRFADITHSEDLSADEEFVRQMIAGERSTYQMHKRYVHADGHVVWVQLNVSLVRDGDGEPMYFISQIQDVTARREAERLRGEAERSLREREGLLRSVIDNDKSLIYVKDLDGRYLLYNTRFVEAFALEERGAAEGVAAHEILLGRDDRWLDPALAPVWRAHDLRALEGHQEFAEFSDDPVRGRLSYDVLKFPLHDDTGAVYATCGVALDTTERALELEQLATTARYFEVSRDLTVTADFGGHFRSVNPALERVLGWSPEEFLARPFIDMVHPDDRAATMREVSKLAEGAVTFNFVNRYEAKDGSYRWLEWNAILSPEEDLMYCAARDVTDRKRVEAALSASERQTRQILETAHDAFVAMDADGLITDWNPQAEAMFGWPATEALGRNLSETIVPAEHREAHRRGLQRVVMGGEALLLGKLLELPAVHRDGHEFPVELTISSVETEHGFSFNAFLRDITERRRVHEQLGLARDEALAASSMKSMFVANVSHEIRTPMNGVIGMSELLLDTALDDEQREYTETISASGEALLEVIDDILDFSKIEAGKLELDPTDFDLRDAIEKVCGLQARRAHRAGLELVVAIDPGLPALLHGDAARLRQVIANFVSNALKFTGEGEVIVRASSTAASDGSALVRVEISDTGIGVEPGALALLFKPFSQADGSTTRKYGGTGLGLAISKQLIELMGGTIGARSEPGKGSSFWFELPLSCPAADARAPARQSDLAGTRVLVVDDNAASRDVLARQLDAWHMSCAVAADATAALELMESAAADGTPYAVALIDRSMPDVDGYELACAIRAKQAFRGTRLILLSSTAGRPEVFDDPGLFDKLLTKPVRVSRLHEELRSVVAGDGAQDERNRMPASSPVHAARAPENDEVLVVEDTPVNQVVAVRMLEKCGFRARVAENGRKALEALSERDYAAVLMDCQMPELDGYQTTRVIRGSEHAGRRTPVIAMTANSMRGEREKCLAAGMDDYLTKPLRNHILKDALRRWVTDPQLAATAAEVAVLTGATERADGPALIDEAVIAELGLEGEGLAELVALFVDQAATQVVELSGAISHGEAPTVARIAHQLKGSSATLGAVRVASVASELEQAAKTEQLSAAPELLGRLRRGLAETR
nr:PAS domain S-box protein [Solirubrobacterales bacterium]